MKNDSNKNIVIEELDDNEESTNKAKEKNKPEEIIEVGDSEQFEGKNIVKIHNDSSETPTPTPNLIEFNERIYPTKSKKIKSSLIGKKRSKK